MAIHNGSLPIVVDRLIFCVDIQDRNCYPGSGNTITDLINGIEGSNTNNVFVPGSPAYMDSNTSSYHKFTDGSTTTYSSGTDFSCFTWVNFNSVAGSDNTWFSKGSNNNNAAGISLQTKSGVLHTGFYGGSWDTITSGTSVSVGQWYYYGATYDHSNLKQYLNGALINTSADSGNFTTGASGVITYGVGTWQNNQTANTYNQDVNLASAELYNKALTANEVLQNFNAKRSRFGI